MRLRIVNRHKIERKFRRNINRSRIFFGFLFGERKERSKKDLSWYGQTRNPYKATEKKDRGLQIKIIIILFSFLSILLMGIYSSFFHLTNIQIEGIQRIDKSKILETVNGILEYKTLGFIPRKSYFIANLDEIRDVLKERFPIKTIVVQKTFPNNIFIVIEEKISTLIYDNGQEYSYVGLQGNIVEKMRKVGDNEWDVTKRLTTSTDEFGEIIEHQEIVDRKHTPDTRTIQLELGDYPIVYDMRVVQAQTNESVITESQVKVIIEWFNAISKTTDIPLKYFVILPEAGELVIYTYEGWFIKTRFDRDVPSQLLELTSLFKEKINRTTISYIDLRYEGRAYWQ